MKTCPYQEYYNLQAGSGIGTVYKGNQFQRGHGLGSFFSSLFRSILPIIRKGAGAIGKQALSTGVSFLGDLNENRPVKESFKNRIKEAGINLKRNAENKIENILNGSGYKKKRLVKKPVHSKTKASKVKSKKKKPSRHIDIFD